MKFNDKLITAIAAIVVDVLFIALKGDVLSIAFTVLGAALIVMGILDAAKKDSKSGTVKIVAGLVTVLNAKSLMPKLKHARMDACQYHALYCGGIDDPLLPDEFGFLFENGWLFHEYCAKASHLCKAGHRSCCRHLSPAEPRRYRLLGVHLYRYCFHR